MRLLAKLRRKNAPRPAGGARTTGQLQAAPAGPAPVEPSLAVAPPATPPSSPAGRMPVPPSWDPPQSDAPRAEEPPPKAPDRPAPVASASAGRLKRTLASLPALPRRIAHDRVLLALTVILGIGLALRVWLTLVWSPAITGYSDSGVYFQDSVESIWHDPIRTQGYTVFLRLLHGISPHLLFVTSCSTGSGWPWRR